MSTNQKNNEEEVDLGSLFVIIGKGFSNFFSFIAIIGLVAGFILEKNKDRIYASDLLVEPNFKSSKQLYDNVNFYNDLVKQKDIERIQKIFNLDKETAESLKQFTIEPIINDNDIIKSYNEFVISVDTTTIKSYTFDEFKVSFTDLDYKTHIINVVANKNDVFDKLDRVILSSVVDNEYYNRIKELTNENLNRTDSLLRQNLVQIDSLRKVYMKVMLEEAKKQSNGTSIDLGGEKRTTKELELFDTNRELNSELKKVVLDKSSKYNVINVISNFQPIGYEVKGITKNKVFQLPILGAFLMILVLLFLKINKYLNNYKK